MESFIQSEECTELDEAVTFDREIRIWRVRDNSFFKDITKDYID